MNQAQRSLRDGSSQPREEIVQTAIRLYRAVGYRKTTVADIARGASMSPANLYRFFPSRQAVEECVVAGLLDEVFVEAEAAARSRISSRERLEAAFGAIFQHHQLRRAHDPRLHELVVAAGQANWRVTLSHADKLGHLVRSIIAAGQASGEFRTGSPMALARCMLDAMDAYLDPSRLELAAGRPAFDEMMNFCVGALQTGAPAQVAGLPSPSPATCLA
ncbi:TetR family transcriptional regulator [Bradyrhizobium sp. CIAT3101]|uniref:TetR/AcrR family transcriptional regulator n=1 Tax=Bradyrhizobium sp. CIAT3101 TaxID=439387 RepID=UPI0024B24703|nr:TetR family transcriptional regulator [Bradyrhizobium sp. CIAT3101]WFU82498.1 TetR family transcriptional regulator [Bradyrhizobium sp. CIAT3101]